MQFISLLLATGTGAGFGVTVDLKDQFGDVTSSFDKFFNKGYAVSSMLLIAVLFTAVSSIFSSLSLPKRAWFLFCLNLLVYLDLNTIIFVYHIICNCCTSETYSLLYSICIPFGVIFNWRNDRAKLVCSMFG